MPEMAIWHVRDRPWRISQQSRKLGCESVQMKRVLLGLIAALVVLSGCGNGALAEQAASVPTPEVTVTATPEATARPVAKHKPLAAPCMKVLRELELSRAAAAIENIFSDPQRRREDYAVDADRLLGFANTAWKLSSAQDDSLGSRCERVSSHDTDIVEDAIAAIRTASSWAENGTAMTGSRGGWRAVIGDEFGIGIYLDPIEKAAKYVG